MTQCGSVEGMSRRAFTAAQEGVLAGEYKAGLNCRELAAKYGTSPQSVRAALRRQGVQARGAAAAQQVRRSKHRAWGEVEHEEAIARYRRGETVRNLAKSYRIRTDAVSALLAERNVPLHPGGRAHPRFRTDEQCQEVAAMYRETPDLRRIAVHFGCSVTPVQKALRRVGVTPQAGRRPFWTEARDVKLTQLHREGGLSREEIAHELGTTRVKVNARLQVLGLVKPRSRPTGPASPMWRGGRYVSKYGYVLIDPLPEDKAHLPPRHARYVQEHRLVMARSLGRPLRRSESVHHINGDRADNRLENLQLRQGQHGAGVVMTCNACGSHDVTPREISTA